MRTVTIVAKGPSAEFAEDVIEGDVATINDSIRLLDRSRKVSFCFYAHAKPLLEFPDRWQDVQTYVGPMIPFGDIHHQFPGHRMILVPYNSCGLSTPRFDEAIRTGNLTFHSTVPLAMHFLSKLGYKKIRIIGCDGGSEYAKGVLVNREPQRQTEKPDYTRWKQGFEELAILLKEYYGSEVVWL